VATITGAFYFFFDYSCAVQVEELNRCAVALAIFFCLAELTDLPIIFNPNFLVNSC
jgi:hypothetical protein